MVRKTRKQKGGIAEFHLSVGKDNLRTGYVVINGEEVQINEGAKLVGKNLSDLDLNKVNLSGADLTDADLRGANLRGANLSGADLTRAHLEKADLTGAKLIVADLKQANLENANLERANLAATKLSGAVLGGADLSYAKLENAKLNGAKLDGANLERAILYGADLSGAVLRGANLKHATLTMADLKQANLEYAYLGSANLSGANLKNANLKNANLEDAYLVNTHLEGADLTDANLTDVFVMRYIYNNSTIWPANYIPQPSAPLPQQPVQETKITLTQNMINSKNSNSCNDKLYKEIMRLTPKEIKDKSFKFQGQSGIDEGGLTRIVHSLFLKSFINKFFEGTETKILKDKVNLDELNKATEILIALTEKTKRVWGHHGEETTGSINAIQIEPSLFNILSAKKVQDYINQNQNKKKYHVLKTKSGEFNLFNYENLNTIGLQLINAKNAINFNKDHIKKYMITFLTMNSFNSYEQYLNMREWIQKYLVPNSTIFSIHLQFDKESFSERVLLKFKNNEGNFFQFKDKEGSVYQEVKLSDFRNRAAFTNYNLLPLFLNYLSDNDEYRKNFNMLVSGSSTYGGILRIIFEEQAKPDALYNAHTCSCEINIYNNVVSMSINDLNGAIEGEIKHIKIQD